MNQISCKTCAFFERATGIDEAGRFHEALHECRRHPPKPEANRFPNVKETDWCGEWQPIESDVFGRHQ
jgi:hypothetical protein